MKKILTTTFFKRLLLCLVTTLMMEIGYAQIPSHALGLRFGGDGNTNGAEISYQHGLGSANRLEFDLGFSSRQYYRNMYLVGIYQWHWNIKGGLNWYIGPGAALGFYDWDNRFTQSSGIYAAVGGQIGIEYNFNKKGAPLLLSLDTRPMWELAGYDNGLGWGAALGLRFTF